MKLEHLDRVWMQENRKKVLTRMLDRVKFASGEVYKMTLDGLDSLEVNRERLSIFLQGEIQALNLELHQLGVELPGVATIEGARAITKGMDQ